MMLRSSGRLISSERPDPGLHEYEVSSGAITSSQSNQNGLLEEQLAELTIQLPSSRRFFPFRTLTAAHIVLDGSVTACLPQRFQCKRLSTLKQALLTCNIL
ncbi:hypothetical protein TNCV_579291 [Trichonephila clavipes]|nr:hypothetical protein TNCV_579291 [Trichonephila clavipes]